MALISSILPGVTGSYSTYPSGIYSSTGAGRAMISPWDIGSSGYVNSLQLPAVGRTFGGLTGSNMAAAEGASALSGGLSSLGGGSSLANLYVPTVPTVGAYSSVPQLALNSAAPSVPSLSSLVVPQVATVGPTSNVLLGQAAASNALAAPSGFAAPVGQAAVNMAAPSLGQQAAANAFAAPSGFAAPVGQTPALQYGSSIGPSLADASIFRNTLSGEGLLGGARIVGRTALTEGLPYYIAGQVASGIAGHVWDNPDSHSDDRLRNALSWGGTGAGIGATVGSIFPVVGTGLGAAAGGLIGGGLGAIFGGGGQTRQEAKEDALKKVSETFSQLGADSAFIQSARDQMELAWQYNDVGNADEVNSIAQQVMDGMMQVYSTNATSSSSTLGGGYATSGTEAARNYEAQIAAAQAMMQPIITQQLASSANYATQYANAQIAAANQISNPQLRDAMIAMARQGQADNAAQNAVALQQMYSTPTYLTDQMDLLYQQQIMDLQQAGLDLAAQQLQAGQTGTGTMIGGVPYMGG